MDFIKVLIDIYTTLALVLIIPLLCLGVFYLQSKYHDHELDKIYKKHGLIPPSGKPKKSAVRTDDTHDID